MHQMKLLGVQGSVVSYRSWAEFSLLLFQVRLLEQQNKQLETKWCLLQEGTSDRSEVEPFYEAYIAALQKQLHMLENDKFKFETENQAVRRQLEDFKTK